MRAHDNANECARRNYFEYMHGPRPHVLNLRKNAMSRSISVHHIVSYNIHARVCVCTQVKSVIPANSVLYFRIHLYDIPDADQYSARTPPVCTLTNILVTCSGRERAYIEKSRFRYTTSQSLEDAITKLIAKRSRLTTVATKTPNWEQVAILKQLLDEKLAEDADEL